MKLLNTILKATGLSAIIFWIILLSNDFELDMLPFLFLSLIPIFICNAIVILLTIAPFFWSKNDSTPPRNIFNMYFPFYAIVCLALSIYGLTHSHFLISFCVAAFFSSLQSWVWITKSYEKPKITHLI